MDFKGGPADDSRDQPALAGMTSKIQGITQGGKNHGRSRCFAGREGRMSHIFLIMERKALRNALRKISQHAPRGMMGRSRSIRKKIAGQLIGKGGRVIRGGMPRGGNGGCRSELKGTTGTRGTIGSVQWADKRARRRRKRIEAFTAEVEVRQRIYEGPVLRCSTFGGGRGIGPVLAAGGKGLDLLCIFRKIGTETASNQVSDT